MCVIICVTLRHRICHTFTCFLHFASATPSTPLILYKQLQTLASLRTKFLEFTLFSDLLALYFCTPCLVTVCHHTHIHTGLINMNLCATPHSAGWCNGFKSFRARRCLPRRLPAYFFSTIPSHLLRSFLADE